MAFQTNIGTGAIRFSEDERMWANVIDVTYVFLRPQGKINLWVNANTEDGVVAYSDQFDESAIQGVSGWGQYGWGSAGWGNQSPNALPLASKTAPARKQWTIPIDEECDKIVCGLNTTDVGIRYQLAGIIVRYVEIGWKDIDN